MNHLAIDAATEVLSVALRVSSAGRGARLVAVRDLGLRHTQRLMPLVDRLLAEAEIEPASLDLVSCTRGPGSFTGLRIGMATAKGLAAAVAAKRPLATPPLVSVPTLDVMASRVPPATIVLPVIDGRKARFYAAIYESGHKLTDDLDVSAVELAELVRTSRADGAVVVTGPHGDLFLERLGDVAGGGTGSRTRYVLDPGFRSGWADALLDCAEVALARDGYDQIDLGPDYVRRSDAEIGRSAP